MTNSPINRALPPVKIKMCMFVRSYIYMYSMSTSLLEARSVQISLYGPTSTAVNSLNNKDITIDNRVVLQ